MQVSKLQIWGIWNSLNPKPFIARLKVKSPRGFWVYYYNIYIHTITNNILDYIISSYNILRTLIEP